MNGASLELSKWFITTVVYSLCGMSWAFFMITLYLLIFSPIYILSLDILYQWSATAYSQLFSSGWNMYIYLLLLIMFV